MYVKIQITVKSADFLPLNRRYIKMGETLRLILTIADVLVCILLIATVLFQSSKDEGLGSMFGGAAETFFGKDKARSLDAKLGKVTAIAAAAFIVLTFVIAVF